MRRRHLTRWFPTYVVAALWVTACGPSQSISVKVDDSTVTVILGGSVSTVVSLVRTGGATADVTLDADGAPAWIAVSFSPATLSGDELASTLTIDTDADDPGAGPTSFELTVTATGGGLSASETVNVEVDLLTVRGRVSGLFGEVRTGVSVSVDGGPPVHVDSLGMFTGPAVAIPYDLVVLDLAFPLAHVYKGLTTTDLLLAEPPQVIAHATTVSGDLSATVGTDQIGIVCVEGVVRFVAGCTQVTTGNTGYAVDAFWHESSLAEAHVHAWVVDLDEDGTTTGFAHEGRQAVTLSDGEPAAVDVTLGDGPGALAVDVTIAPTSGVPYAGSTWSHRYGELASVPLPSGSATTSYTAVLPDVPGTTSVLRAAVVSEEVEVLAWEVLPEGGDAIELVMPPALTMVAPTDGATGVDLETEFSVSNPAGSPVTFIFGGPVVYYVTTPDPVTTLPDLAALGLPLPSGESFTWRALTLTHLPTVDDLARVGWFTPAVEVGLLPEGGPGPAAAGSLAAAADREFTTE